MEGGGRDVGWIILGTILKFKVKTNINVNNGNITNKTNKKRNELNVW